MHEIPDMHAVLVLHALEGTRGRAADLAKARVQSLEFLDPRVSDEVHLLSIATAEDVADEMAVRRVTEFGALLELGGREAMEIQSLGELDRVGGGLEALHNNDALEVTTTRATGDLDELLRAVDHPNLRAQFDLYHMARQGLDIPAGIRLLAGRIGHVQFADCPGRGEPGRGQLDFAPLLQALQASGYAGWLGAEYKPSQATEQTLGWLPAWQAL